MNPCKIFGLLILGACALVSVGASAAPLELKISNSRGEAWTYYRATNGQWVLEQKAVGATFLRRPLAKLHHERIFEDLRRSVLRGAGLSASGVCPGMRARVELGGFSKPQIRELCLGRLAHKDLYGRILGRLDEAQGKKGSGRRLFSR